MRMHEEDWSRQAELRVKSAVPRPTGSQMRGPCVTWEEYGQWAIVWEEYEGVLDPRWARRASRRFQKRPEDESAPHRPLLIPPLGGQEGPGPAEAQHRAVEGLLLHQGPIPELAHDWQEFVYTDGSHIKETLDGVLAKGAPGIGAAVYIPCRKAADAVSCVMADGAYCNTMLGQSWPQLTWRWDPTARRQGEGGTAPCT
jgi:hypothetical protein